MRARRRQLVHQPSELQRTERRLAYIPGAGDRWTRQHGRDPASFTWTIDTAAPSASITGGPSIRVTTRADVHLYGRRGGLLVRVPPRRRCVRHVCEPPRPGCPHGGLAHVHRARDRRGGKHRAGRQPYLDSRPHGTRDDDLVRAERSHGRHVRGLRLRLERGGLDVPVRARRRRVQRLQQPAELRRPDDKLTFSVYATDAAGNVDASPATFTWTIS